jgi:excisionase family DNA binding protein
MTQLMTVGELGQYLRFSKRTIYRLLKQGSIPAIKIGNKWRFDKEAIDKWLRQRIKGAKARILVIDDDELVTFLFKQTLEDQGHTVVTVGNGATGIQYVKQWDFDLVFLDLKMPGMDGAEVLRQIRGIRPGLPVTIITGYPDSEMMARALEQGPFGAMNKPFNSSDIVAAVNSFLYATHTRR